MSNKILWHWVDGEGERYTQLTRHDTTDWCELEPELLDLMYKSISDINRLRRQLNYEYAPAMDSRFCSIDSKYKFVSDELDAKDID